MRYATIQLDGRTAAVRVDGNVMTEVGHADVGALLAAPEGLSGAATSSGPQHEASSAEVTTLVPQPGKIICVGLNYVRHIQEMGRELPEYPTLFAKFAGALIGARDDIVKPPETAQLDWEAELAVVIGSSVRRATAEEAEASIAGFTVLNDVTCRDWQFRTREWLQGKTWDATTPLGPVLVTPDELPGGARPTLRVTCEVDGTVMQADSTGDLLFDPVALVQYVSTVTRLHPGDIIATGTPGGVGHARTPEVFLSGGELLVTSIEGIGRLENRVVAEGDR